MNASPPRLAFLAPMRPELRPLVKRLGLRPQRIGHTELHVGTIGDTEVVAALTGIGTQRAEEATERLLDAVEVSHLVVVGVAGGIAPAIEVREVMIPEVVVDGPTGAEYRPAPLGDTTPHGKLRTSDEYLLDRDALARLVEQGVTALDMETATIAAVCERRGCPWSVVRAISDMATDDQADAEVLGLARPDGTANVPAVLRYVIRRPSRLAHLMRLGRDATVAANAAAATAVRAGAQLRLGA